MSGKDRGEGEDGISFCFVFLTNFLFRFLSALLAKAFFRCCLCNNFKRDDIQIDDDPGCAMNSFTKSFTTGEAPGIVCLIGSGIFNGDETLININAVLVKGQICRHLFVYVVGLHID